MFVNQYPHLYDIRDDFHTLDFGSGDLIIKATRMFTSSYLAKGQIIREFWKQNRQWKIP